MPVRILTVRFDRGREVFDDSELQAFLLNKRVGRVETAFFHVDGSPYWSLLIEYDEVLERATAQTDELGEAERLLLQRLREWRKATADAEGVPAYFIATNSQLKEVAVRSPISRESLKGIRGFGARRMERYGDKILDLVKAFLDQEPQPTTHAG
ncbi:HRDC domain-containing protein [Candidatus Fermentibacteria bacterium]|nr:HRDC domain-containing protein [Candidatus Fermentibacteria bacterium]